ERSIKDSSCRKLGDDSDAFTIKKVDFSGGDFAGLQTWDDPTPRSSSQYTDEEVLDLLLLPAKGVPCPGYTRCQCPNIWKDSDNRMIARCWKYHCTHMPSKKKCWYGSMKITVIHF
ncbi:hypothetical protein E2562_006059, partial [Oryza meyeriana var. granulata]